LISALYSINDNASINPAEAQRPPMHPQDLLDFM